MAIRIAWYNCQNSQNCPKVLTESANNHLGSSDRESQKSLSHRPNPVSHRGRVPKKGLRTVQETVLGVSPQRPQITFLILVKALLGILAVLTVVPGNQNRKVGGRSA